MLRVIILALLVISFRSADASSESCEATATISHGTTWESGSKFATEFDILIANSGSSFVNQVFLSFSFPDSAQITSKWGIGETSERGYPLILYPNLAVGASITAGFILEDLDIRNFETVTVTLTSVCDNGSGSSGKQTLICDVVIVGGGLSGLTSAEALENNGHHVCLFEKEDRWGGRYYDVFYDGIEEPIGLGGWRLDQNHKRMWKLINRLNIPTIPWTSTNGPIEARGVIATSSPELQRVAFPSLGSRNVKEEFTAMTENINDLFVKYPDLYTFGLERLGMEGLAFLMENLSGHKAPFYNNVDAVSYMLEYRVHEGTDSGNVSRPAKGLSAITNGLVEKLQAKGSKIFLNEGVENIEQLNGVYTVTTDSYIAIANSLILSPTPIALRKIKGRVVAEIIKQKEFQSINSQLYFKGGAIYASAWWEPYLATLQSYSTGTTCLGSLLPAPSRGPNGEALIHHIYSDAYCAYDLWQYVSAYPKTAIDQVIKKKLQFLFPNVTVPDPLLSAYKFWDEGAVHVQNAGSGVSFAQVQAWAVTPLGNTSRVYLVGEHYGIRRAWGEGALMTVENALKSGWGILL